MAICKNCNSELPAGAMFCMKCGTKVETELFCPQCGEKLPAGAAFCMKCGAKIGGAAATKQDVQYDKIVVSPDGSTGYSSIQAAVDAASDGMMIEIMPGTYKENIEIGRGIGHSEGTKKKNIALVGIADDNGKFPKITTANKSFRLIHIYGDVNLYRLDLDTGGMGELPCAISAISDSFVYSELNFDGELSVSSISKNFEKDCEISNCTITKEIYDDENNNFSKIEIISWEHDTPNLVKVRDCNFEKGKCYTKYCDIENCNLGVIKPDWDPFSCKNSTIKHISENDYNAYKSKFVNCKFLDK